MRKNLLITGGAGFIGVNLVDFFLDKGNFKITVLDNLSTGSFTTLESITKSREVEIIYNYSNSNETILFVNGDIRDKEIVEQTVKGQDIIIHLAAETGVIPSVKNPYKDADVNIFGTLNLLNAAVKHKVSKFILASSAAPLGNQIPPNNEDKAAKPLSPYGASKLAAEGYCFAFYGSFGLNTTILRFSNVYGPYSFNKGSVIAQFIKKIMRNETLEVFGDGKQTRDYLFVTDIASAMEKVIKSGSDNSVKGELFQLGTEKETSIIFLLKLLKTIIHRDFNVIYKKKRGGEILRNYTSISKIRKNIDFEPETDLATGLKKTWEWFKKSSNMKSN